MAIAATQRSTRTLIAQVDPPCRTLQYVRLSWIQSLGLHLPAPYQMLLLRSQLLMAHPSGEVPKQTTALGAAPEVAVASDLPPIAFTTDRREGGAAPEKYPFILIYYTLLMIF